MTVRLDRTRAADLVVVLFGIVHGADPDAWYLPTVTAVQAELQGQLRAAEVTDAHDRFAEIEAA